MGRGLGRPRRYEFWRPRLLTTYAEQEERHSDRLMHQHLKEAAKAFANDPDIEKRQLALAIPGERTVTRIREEWQGLPPEEQAKYRLVRWPASFLRGDFEWTDGEYVVELLTARSEPRPSGRLAKWYVHISQCVPRADAADRRIAAALMSIAEMVYGKPDPSVIEWMESGKPVRYRLSLSPEIWANAGQEADYAMGEMLAKASRANAPAQELAAPSETAPAQPKAASAEPKDNIENGHITLEAHKPEYRSAPVLTRAGR
jgi:hypothetical protein